MTEMGILQPLLQLAASDVTVSFVLYTWKWQHLKSTHVFMLSFIVYKYVEWGCHFDCTMCRVCTVSFPTSSRLNFSSAWTS